jgi:branched-chain amino acid transport system permease protein
MSSFEILAQIMVSGLMVGLIYGLAALGFTIVYNATQIVNFANGEYLMIGGMILAVLAQSALDLPIYLSVLIAVGATAILGYLTQTVIINNTKSRDPMTLVMLTIGLAVALRGLVSFLFGRDVKFVPDFGVFNVILIGNMYIPSQAIWVFLTFIVVTLGIWFLFNRTLVGKAMQAVSLDPHAAALCGINPGNLAAMSFALAAGIGALAGAVAAPIQPVFYENGMFLGLKGFAAAVAGGFGNPAGAILGGLIIGLVESLAAGYGASGYKDAIAFVLLILILLVRPAGMIGKAHVSRV